MKNFCKGTPFHPVSSSTKEQGPEQALALQTCHTCKKCNTEKHIKAFDGSSTTCKQCAEGTSVPICDACDTPKPRHAFDAKMLDNAQTFQREQVCKACYANGMSPKDVKKYRCIECGERVHLKFTEKDRRRYLTSTGYAQIATQRRKTWRKSCARVRPGSARAPATDWSDHI